MNFSLNNHFLLMVSKVILVDVVLLALTWPKFSFPGSNTIYSFQSAFRWEICDVAQVHDPWKWSNLDPYQNQLLAWQESTSVCAYLLLCFFFFFFGLHSLHTPICINMKGCYNKVPQTGSLKHKKFISSQFWRLNIRGQDVGRFDFS